MHLFGSSGIRNLANRHLFDLAFKVGLSVGSVYGNVVVGQDTRTTSSALKHAIISGLLAAGAGATDIGVSPTPTLAFVTRDYRAGIMITASHNPPEYNGIKLWNPDGSAFDIKQQSQIEEMVVTNAMAVADWSAVKPGGVRSDAIDWHSERITRDFTEKVRARVVVDCGCGAGSLVTPYVLRELGCEVIAINSHLSGFFPRPIEPNDENLAVLKEATLRFGAAVGIAHDGDADRMMAVDDRGRFVPGDKLLVMLGRAVEAKDVVTTVDASMAIEDAGFQTRRTRVGDSFVSAELKSGGGDFGGEPAGAWIFPGVSFCPDGIYAALKIASVAAAHKLSEMADLIKSFPLKRGSVGSDGIDMEQMESRLMALKPVSVNKSDGLRLAFDDGWLLVRPSGTEPRIRLTAEAKTEVRARELYDRGLSLVQGGGKA